MGEQTTHLESRTEDSRRTTIEKEIVADLDPAPPPIGKSTSSASRRHNQGSTDHNGYRIGRVTLLESGYTEYMNTRQYKISSVPKHRKEKRSELSYNKGSEGCMLF